MRKCLRFNNLTGIIPPELCNVTSLEELRLTYNQLGGSIPGGIGKLTELRTLSLAINRISGGIPESLFNLSLLQLLSLTGNRLDGQLPPAIGNAFPNLQFLDLATNMLEGFAPASLCNLSSIQEMDFKKISLEGKIRVPFGMLPGLIRMDLELNNLEAKDNADWQFFNALRNCSHLQMLGLTGTSCRESCQVTSVTFLPLFGTYLWGVITIYQAVSPRARGTFVT